MSDKPQGATMRYVPSFVFSMIYRAYGWAERIRRNRLRAVAEQHAPGLAAQAQRIAREVWAPDTRVTVEHDREYETGDPMVRLHVHIPCEPLAIRSEKWHRFMDAYLRRVEEPEGAPWICLDRAYLPHGAGSVKGDGLVAQSAVSVPNHSPETLP